MNQFKLVRRCRCNSCGVKLRIFRLFALVATLAIFDCLDLRTADGQSSCPCGCGGVGGCSLLNRAVTTARTTARTAAIDARVGGRFSATATDGPTGSRGNAATITWGIAPDGTAAPVSGSGQSSLISFLDGIRDTASTGGSDLTQRSWFTLFEQSTNRIAELSGASFVYEPKDDGSTLGTLATGGGVFPGPNGQPGVRADVRIGGGVIDGANGTLAFALGPNSGDVTFDTGDGGFFSGTANDSRFFRNVLTHELYHSLGIQHVETASFAEVNLLNPFATGAIDGPQLDDILTLQRNYGDALERANDQAGNDTINTATKLGLLAIDNALSAGQEVDDSRIGIDEVGFLSIDSLFDVDVFEFSVGAEATIALELNPEGATYSQGVEGGTPTDLNSLELNDLTLRVLDASGNLVATSSAFGLGESELIVETLAAGRYFAEVSGELDEIQLFTLNISAVPEPSSAGIMICSIVALQLRRRRK